MQRFTQDCIQAGWPFLLAANSSDVDIVGFVRRKDPGLVIVLGQFPLSPDVLAIPSNGLIQVCHSEMGGQGMEEKEGLQIRIEHFTRDSEAPFVLASLTVPSQPYAGFLGSTLKTDLISNDLLIQTAASLQTESATRASEKVTEWIHRIFSPYLTQLQAASIKTAQNVPAPPRCRPAWKLCMQTLLLCSPFVIARNCYRHWRGRYPVLIMAHHLVSDRPHRMGISTEMFWRQVRFLQRHYRIVSLSEALELLRSSDVKVPTIALTFDDGYADNFVSLRAVMEEEGLPVALFIASDPVENHREFLHDLVNGSRGALPLTWDQIEYWSLRGAEFGSHTRTHFDCGSTDRARLEREIIGSKDDLQRHLAKPVQVFAFPFGQPQNMSSEAVNIAEYAYPYFVSDFGGENLPGQAGSRQHLFRKGLYADLWELELDLQSIFDLSESIRRQLHFKRTEPGASLQTLSLLPSGRPVTGLSASETAD
jgi:peptidoglycan/xylan/chitin deacetylase (PgdA/CDA1 family)